LPDAVAQFGDFGDDLFVSIFLVSVFYDCCITGPSRLVVGPALNI